MARVLTKLQRVYRRAVGNRRTLLLVLALCLCLCTYMTGRVHTPSRALRFSGGNNAISANVPSQGLGVRERLLKSGRDSNSAPQSDNSETRQSREGSEGLSGDVMALARKDTGPDPPTEDRGNGGEGNGSTRRELPTGVNMVISGINVTALGCFTDRPGRTERALQDDLFADYRKMTVELCLRRCKDKSYEYAGLEYGAECYCGPEIHRDSDLVPSSECNTSCVADQTSTCGGKLRVFIYRVELPLTSHQRALPRVRSADDKKKGTVNPKDDNFRGCYPMAPDFDKAFTSPPLIDERQAPKKCLTHCFLESFTFAVLYNTTVCQCADISEHFHLRDQVADDTCDHRCPDDRAKSCGSLTHFSVYRTVIQDIRCTKTVLLPTNSRPLTALVSFPGSGNTWVRHLIEKATGIYTGSFYNDGDLFNKGFIGEKENWLKRNTVAVKSHRFDRAHIEKFDSAILIIRNPYNAIVSEHNRKHGGHTGLARQTKYHSQEWVDFVTGKSQTWTNTAMNWIRYCRNLLIVYYEDLQRDVVGQIRRVLKFLDLPVSEERMFCLEANKDGKFKRHKHIDFDPYTPEMRASVNLYIHTVALSLKLYNKTDLPEEYRPEL
ncbi:WSCD2 [Branchiostoma lanceolatum]|uniref:WSCD2 protein n=1 Tax=Branchiostoma lanceolatum TaxID=7740 RepID=A0A8J9VLA7_BRALA|nr:WSCD2 [Branchiostoma lanceolatum]